MNEILFDEQSNHSIHQSRRHILLVDSQTPRGLVMAGVSQSREPRRVGHAGLVK